jgi:hypothetical protein
MQLSAANVIRGPRIQLDNDLMILFPFEPPDASTQHLIQIKLLRRRESLVRHLQIQSNM